MRPRARVRGRLFTDRMRESAQKRKKSAGGDEAIPPPRAHAPEAAVGAAAGAPAEFAARRPAPDPQQPPVVAPALMPAIGLEVREDVSAVAVATAESEGVALTPVVEGLMSATTPPRPPAAPFVDEQAAEQRGDAETSADSPARQGRGVEVAEAEGADWGAGDEARLLVQSPRRLFLYWRFARDPRELLREALGPVAERYAPAVRLVDAASGEEGEPAAAEGGGGHWFDVLPGRLLRADVGFRGEGLPFVRLISSNTVETPAVGVSRVEDEAPEFRVGAPEFERVLEATGFAAEEWHAEAARRETPDPVSLFARARLDTPTRTDEPLRPRASSDTARPTSSPHNGGHFSNTRGGELF